MRTWLLAASLFLLPPFVIGGAALAQVPAELAGYAIVRGDGLLQVQGRIVYLHGIYIPPTGQTCRARVRPIRCSSRAALALDDKVRGLVRCAVQRQNADGSLGAFCSVDGRSVLDADVDLGAWLIQQGWAVAAPGAPFEYGVLEDIARTQRQGVWGFQLDGRSRRWPRRGRRPRPRAGPSGGGRERGPRRRRHVVARTTRRRRKTAAATACPWHGCAAVTNH